MIKPSSGGFDMHKWADSKKIIKGLENDLTTFVDEVNRLTAIIKELEQELERCKGYKICTAKILCGYKKEFEEAKE